MTQATTTAPPSISEARFQKLVAKLRELFELDKSDLDFGIYRIMAAKNEEITTFLNRHLKETVEKSLAEHGAGAVDQIEDQIAKARKAAADAGFNPDESPKVKELESQRGSAGGASAEELQADIYNHLLNFFSRYYDEGDFISKRRYKGDTYAIPYSGEEVTLHWANKDQYYIKSGEWHKDYRFTVGSGKRVRFALVDATQETGNNKEPDESKRRYILVENDPVVVEGETLTLRFHFRAPTDADSKRADDDAVAIYGGKYAGSKKGDERTRFCADAEQRALEHIPAEWKALVTAESPTDDKPERTVLGKHLDGFTARNTFDYFIHKDLGGFLRRELDFYIKNEVVRLDDLDDAEPGHLRRVQGRVKAIRRVARPIIDMLESTENFQKKLWLKKKFVLNTSWLVTVDRVPSNLRDIVVANKKQWAEWERLGFKPESDEAKGLFDGAKWGTRAYLDACDKMVVDTRLFDEAFTAEILSSDTALAERSGIDEATTGILVNGENYAALRLLRDQLHSAVKCMYIDPPYNTGKDGFAYKDKYPHSSWLALYSNRLAASGFLLSDDGVVFSSIDENELPRLRMANDACFGQDNRVGTIVWKGATDNNPTRIAMEHEYVHCHAKNKGTVSEHWSANTNDVKEIMLEEFERIKASNRDLDDIRVQFEMWASENRELLGDLYRYRRVDEDGPYVARRNMENPGKPGPRYDVIHPRTGKPCTVPEWGWRFTESKMQALLDADRIIFGDTEEKIPELKVPLREVRFPLRSVVHLDSRKASNTLDRMFGSRDIFKNSKPVELLETLVDLVTEPGELVMDYFAGSGATGHTVVELNRKAGIDHQNLAQRKFVLVEMGDHFTGVMVPRIAKTLYASDWKGGRAQTHDQGLSALVKCFAVESYEDALNNLPTPGMLPSGTPDTMLRYALDLQLGPHLLDLEAFRDPWGYCINAQLAGDDEIKPHKVDLVETFNYLLGLKVSAYGPVRRYSAEFREREHPDGLDSTQVANRPKPDPNGRFVFQNIEGVLNDTSGTSVQVIWRKISGNKEEDAAMLDWWMEHGGDSKTERSEYRNFNLTYVNGPVTRRQPTQGLRTVMPIEEAFKQKMFEDTDGSI